MRMKAAALDVLPVSRLCKALGDETRLRIVALLSHGELCVCHLEDALGLTQPNASRQLAVLKQAGIVTGRREGNWVLYKLAPQADADCEALLRLLVGGFARREVLRRDVERLLKAKGPKPCT
jgi:ArsR family transcriptional regulator, arsenate/arsenite/antimonite-responsive transcriptional repressor